MDFCRLRQVNEQEEFRAYTEFPEYKAEKKSDTAYLGRFPLPMLLALTGFQCILTILARGYLFRYGRATAKIIPHALAKRWPIRYNS